MAENALARSARASSAPASALRPENRRTIPPPVRQPAAACIRAWAARQRQRLHWLGRARLLALQLAAASLVLLALSAGGKLLWGYLRSAPAFATTRIEVRGSVQLSQAEIARSAGLALGQNVFQVSAEQASDRLAQNPWLASASVQRRLPGTYLVQVQERRAIAVLAAGELYLVDEQGRAFKALGPSDPADLPLITGIDPSSIEHDKHAAAAGLVDAIGLLREYAESGLERREPISEVHVEPDDTLSCYVGADASYVRLGKPPFRSKLRRLREVFGQLTSQHTRAQHVYLDNEHRPDRVTVRLR